MIHRHMSALLPLLAVACAASCTSERVVRSQTSQVSVGSTYDALAAKLKDCERSKRACIDASACEPAALTLCTAEFAACGEAARVEEHALRAATDACRSAEDACREVALDRAAKDACRQEREACMRPTQPEEPPCHAELRTCLEMARADELADPVVIIVDEEADDAGVEPAPGHGPKPKPAAHEPGAVPEPPAPKEAKRPKPRAPRPESAAERACHELARACMIAEPVPGEHVHCPGEERPVPPLPEPPPPPAAGGPAPAGAPALPPPPAAGADGSI